MLDTSALIGLHEAQAEVSTFLSRVLNQFDDGTVPKVHHVTLGELWTGVLAVGSVDDENNPRRPVLDTAVGLDLETVTADDARAFAQITNATGRAMSHNDRWIGAAAMRTRSALVTQDAGMAAQLKQYFASLNLIDELRTAIPVVCVPRDPSVLPGSLSDARVNAPRTEADVADLLEPLDESEAEILTLRFGVDQGTPRTLRQVAELLGLTAPQVGQIEKRALDRIRSNMS